MLASLLLLLLLLVAPASAGAADTWTRPFVGVEVLHRTTTNPTRNIWAVRVDLDAQGVSLLATEYPGSTHRTPQQWAQMVGAQIAVNGDFFGGSCNPAAPICTWGLAAGNGNWWPNASMGGGNGKDDKNRGVMFFNDKSQIEIPPQGNQVTIPSWARHAVGNYGDVLRNGQVLASPVGQECAGKPPRTFGGISQTGRVLILGTADGYNITGTNYVGFSCQEIGAFLLELGAWTGVNFDGGNSTAMYIQGYPPGVPNLPGNENIVNIPANLTTPPGKVATVANHIGIKATPNGTTPPPTGTCAAKDAAGLVTCLANAVGGDTIELTPGATYTTSSGFLLRDHGCKGTVTIRSGTLAGLPADTRVAPAQAASMAKLSSSSTNPAVTTVAGTRAGCYALQGVELTTSATFIYNIVQIGDRFDLPAVLPTSITFDRVYIHGLAAGQARNGILYNGHDLTIKDSYIDEIKEVGGESHALSLIAGKGPVRLVNNHLEAAGINVLFGGSGVHPSTPVGEQPRDIQILRNRFTKSERWRPGSSTYAGTNYTVKNHLEFKVAKDALVEGNTFENLWYGGDQRHSFVLTVRGEGTMAWANVTGITLRSNTFKNIPNWFNMHAFDPASPTGYTVSAVGAGLLTCTSPTQCSTTGPHGMTVGSPYGTYAIERTSGSFTRNDRVTAIVQSVQSSTAFTVSSSAAMSPLPSGASWKRWSSQVKSSTIRLTNNLVNDAWTNQTSGGFPLAMIQLVRAPDDVQITHNTIVSDQNLIASGPSGDNPVGLQADKSTSVNTGTGFVLQNNILAFGQYGITLPSGNPQTALSTNFASPIATGNLWWGTNAAAAGSAGPMPAGNFYESSTSAIGFANPGADDYRLHAAGSRCDYRKGGACQATDGTDLGVDMVALLAAQGGTQPPIPPAPTVSLNATPANVVSGESTTLTWASKEATSCTASQGWAGAKATQGTEVLPNRTATATYTLTCTGSGGTTATSTTVTVTTPPPPTGFQCQACYRWQCPTCTPPAESWSCQTCTPPTR